MSLVNTNLVPGLWCLIPDASIHVQKSLVVEGKYRLSLPELQQRLELFVSVVLQPSAYLSFPFAVQILTPNVILPFVPVGMRVWWVAYIFSPGLFFDKTPLSYFRGLTVFEYVNSSLWQFFFLAVFTDFTSIDERRLWFFRKLWSFHKLAKEKWVWDIWSFWCWSWKFNVCVNYSVFTWPRCAVEAFHL